MPNPFKKDPDTWYELGRKHGRSHRRIIRKFKKLFKRNPKK